MARTLEKEREFLEALASTCSVAKACTIAKITRQRVYEWREEDPDFAIAWERAKQLGADVLEDEAVRRAHQGIGKPIYYKGELVDTVREYSDTLLIFLLKGAKPDIYKDRISSEVSGPGGGPLTIDSDQPSTLAAIIAAGIARANAKPSEDDISDLA